MQYYVVLDGDTLKFQKTKPKASYGMYVTADEEQGGRENLWHEYSDSVRKVQFLDPISPVSTRSWFFYFTHLESFDKTNLDLSRATDLVGMFHGCGRLQTLDLSGLDTSKVTSMENTFCRCDSLTDADLTGWDTSNVKNFQSMFSYCRSLPYLDISSFSMESATDISDMFASCIALKTLHYPKRPAKRNLTANYTFYSCMSLRSLNWAAFGKLSAWDKYSVLSGCPNLTDIRVFANNIHELKDLVYL